MSSVTPPVIGVPPDIPRLRGRATRTLFAGVALGSTAMFAAITTGPLLAEQLTGTAAYSGIPGASAVLGTAAGSTVLSRVMQRLGRRPALILGYLLGAAGATAVVASAVTGAFWVLLTGMVLIGGGNGSNQLARYAAADLQPAHRRAYGLGLVVWAGTVGALAGPNMLAPAGAAAEAVGLPRLAGSYAGGLVAFAVAVLVYALFLRPEPETLVDRTGESVADWATSAPRSEWRRPAVRVALASLVAGQGIMVLIMTMTPVHIRHGGHGLGIVGFVMSSHVVGMYVLAPVIGRLGDRFGLVPVIGTGHAMLAAAGLSAALAPSSGGLLAAPLALLGFGWSLSFVASSALLTRDTPVAARPRVQGTADTVVWTVAAASSLGSGPILAAVGYPVLALLGAGLVALPAAVLLGYRRGVRAAVAG